MPILRRLEKIGRITYLASRRLTRQQGRRSTRCCSARAGGVARWCTIRAGLAATHGIGDGALTVETERTGADWVTVPLKNDANTVVTSNDNPHGNNTEGNGLTGTSGGAYFVDDPVYIHLTADLPAGATDLRFRYSTDAAYLDTGWFVDDVMVNGAAATVSSASGEWFETTGIQDNNWTVQVVAS